MPDNNPAFDQELAKKEIAIREKQTEHGFQHAMQILQDQKEIAKLAINAQQTNSKLGFWLIVVFVVSCVVIVGMSLHANHPELVTGILKVVALVLGSGGTGYAIGFHRGKQAKTE